MRPKPSTCRACRKLAEEGSFYCSTRCGERWRRSERQRLYWCARALIDAGALSWDGEALTVVVRLELDDSLTLRVLDQVSGQTIPARVTRSEVLNRTPKR